MPSSTYVLPSSAKSCNNTQAEGNHTAVSSKFTLGPQKVTEGAGKQDSELASHGCPEHCQEHFLSAESGGSLERHPVLPRIGPEFLPRLEIQTMIFLVKRRSWVGTTQEEASGARLGSLMEAAAA